MAGLPINAGVAMAESGERGHLACCQDLFSAKHPKNEANNGK